jgi:hypothetical protein
MQASSMITGNPSSPKKRILLGQLGARGDCLYATAIARQIKHDFPSCHLTWAVGSMARSILNGNPHVDRVWEFPMESHADMAQAWMDFEREAFAAKRRGEFDEIFLTQIYPNNFQNFDGTVRSSILRGYPRPITVPVEPLIFLGSDEVENVRRFANIHKLSGCKTVILFECTVNSGQSFVSPEFALEFSYKLIERFADVRVVLSSNAMIQTKDERIIDGSKLSFRENAELTKYCTLLIGGSSGISWLCTSNWAKPLPMIQLLKKSSSVFASFVHDFEHRGANTSEIIEMTECLPDKLVQCVTTAIAEGFEVSRERFHEKIPVNFNYYYLGVLKDLLYAGRIGPVLGSIRNTVSRYGMRAVFNWSFLALLTRWLGEMVARRVARRFIT